MFSWLKKTYFTIEEKNRIARAVRLAESQTSGEIRIFIESKCKTDALTKAKEVFSNLKIQETQHRNGVLLYVAMRDHKFAIYADAGIYKHTTPDFWNQQLAQLKKDFEAKHFATGITHCVFEIGKVLQTYFPDNKRDKNELPDDIVFGKM